MAVVSTGESLRFRYVVSFFISTKGKMNLENLSILSEYLKKQNIKFRWRMLAI